MYKKEIEKRGKNRYRVVIQYEGEEEWIIKCDNSEEALIEAKDGNGNCLHSDYTVISSEVEELDE